MGGGVSPRLTATTTPIKPQDGSLPAHGQGQGQGAESSRPPAGIDHHVGASQGVTITPTVTVTSARRYPKNVTPIDDSRPLQMQQQQMVSQQQQQQQQQLSAEYSFGLAGSGAHAGLPGVPHDQTPQEGAGVGASEQWVTISEVHLMIQDPEGELHRVTFDFDHSEDTPANVAVELVESGLVPAETNVQILSERITQAVALASGLEADPIGNNLQAKLAAGG